MPKIDYKKLQKKLSYQRKNVWEEMSDKDKKNALQFSEGYKEFLNSAKTEREAVRMGINYANNNGFKNITDCQKL